jgi:hypothetical protein
MLGSGGGGPFFGLLEMNSPTYMQSACILLLVQPYSCYFFDPITPALDLVIDSLSMPTPFYGGTHKPCLLEYKQPLFRQSLCSAYIARATVLAYVLRVQYRLLLERIGGWEWATSCQIRNAVRGLEP